MLRLGVGEIGVGRTVVTAWELHRSQAHGAAASQAQKVSAMQESTEPSGFSKESLLIFLCKGLQCVNGGSNSFF